MSRKCLSFGMLSVVCLALCSLPCAAKNIYVAQLSVGADSGADCSSAHSASWFNNSSNWGPGATQISAGDTIHLCGTFTGTANSNMLDFKGSGSSGQPVTVLFETGAKMTAAYWGDAPLSGAITCSGRSWIVVDGGTNGIIEATANGTMLANQQGSTGVYLNQCNNSEVRNLNINNMYIHVGLPMDDGCQCGQAIVVQDSSNVNVHNNAVHDTRWGVNVQYDGTITNLTVANNLLYNFANCITVGDGNGNSTMTTVLIDNNECHDMANWDTVSDFNHCEDIHTFATNPGSTINNLTVRNNYFHGTMGTHATGGNFNSCASNAGCTGWLFYNNIIQSTDNGPTDGYFVFGNTTGAQVYNNTVVGCGGCGTAIEFSSATGTIVKNNILTGVTVGIYATPTSSLATSDYNEVNCGNPSQCMIYQGTGQTWAAWQSLGFDVHGLGGTSNPGLDASFHLTAGSPGIGAGANLTAVNISALDVDRLGMPRLPTGAWDLGAYASTSIAGKPLPPSGLIVVVN